MQPSETPSRRENYLPIVSAVLNSGDRELAGMNVMASAQEVATRLISGVLPIFLLRFWLRSFLQHHALLFKFLHIRVRVFLERL